MLGVGKRTVQPDEELDDLRGLIAGDDTDEAPIKKTDRRGILKLAGGALLGAAGAVAVRAIPASAATGGYMVIGPNTIVALGAQGATGVQGQGNAAVAANEVGVLGTSKSGSGTGVRGSVGGGTGVEGLATSG